MKRSGSGFTRARGNPIRPGCLDSRVPALGLLSVHQLTEGQSGSARVCLISPPWAAAEPYPSLPPNQLVSALGKREDLPTVTREEGTVSEQADQFEERDEDEQQGGTPGHGSGQTGQEQSGGGSSSSEIGGIGSDSGSQNRQEGTEQGNRESGSQQGGHDESGDSGGPSGQQSGEGEVEREGDLGNEPGNTTRQR